MTLSANNARSSSRTLSLLIIVLFASALYLYVFPSPTLAYIGVVLLHAGIGILAAIFLIPRLLHIFRQPKPSSDTAWLFIALGAGTGIVLLVTGTPRPHWNLMYTHIGFSLAGVALLAVGRARSKGWLTAGTGAALVRYGLCLALAATAGIGGWHLRQS